MKLLKKWFIDFLNNFNFSDMMNLISNINIADNLKNWKIIAVILLFAIFFISERWRPFLLKFMYSLAIFLYISLVLIILKNSDISEPAVFFFMITNLIGAIGIGIYKHLMN
ncbi:MAG: hypothetical protein AABZ11_07470 [Nitrospinota bacterium]